VDLAPDFYDAWIKLGIAYMESGREPDAERAYRAAREVNPNGTLAPLNMGILRYSQGEREMSEGRTTEAAAIFAEAQEFLSEAVALNPVSAPAHFYRGASLYRLGSYPEAEVSLLRAVDLDPFSQARLTLINVYVRLNRADAALAQAEAFLQTNPEAPEREAIERARDQLRGALGL
jgi:Flp pilus assembly protein TadD